MNALAERFPDSALETAAPDDRCLALLVDRNAAIRQMYRKIMLCQTFRLAPVTRDGLRLLLGLAQKDYAHGRNRLVTRPVIPEVRDTIEAGTLRLDFQVDGQTITPRPAPAPADHGQDFVAPFGWPHFSELLGLLLLHARHPDALAHGHHVMFSPSGNASKDGFFGLDGLWIRTLRRWSAS
ncbi:hypothetical protein FHR25_005297 [Yokenella regensburgei]|nr:hypothetical protein FHR25_005297 [Yokenella regensburgei]